VIGLPVSQRVMLSPFSLHYEGGGSMTLWNTGILLHHYTVIYNPQDNDLNLLCCEYLNSLNLQEFYFLWTHFYILCPNGWTSKIIMIKKTYYWILSWANSIQSISLHCFQ